MAYVITLDWQITICFYERFCVSGVSRTISRLTDWPIDSSHECSVNPHWLVFGCETSIKFQISETPGKLHEVKKTKPQATHQWRRLSENQAQKTAFEFNITRRNMIQPYSEFTLFTEFVWISNWFVWNGWYGMIWCGMETLNHGNVFNDRKRRCWESKATNDKSHHSNELISMSQNYSKKFEF